MQVVELVWQKVLKSTSTLQQNKTNQRMDITVPHLYTGLEMRQINQKIYCILANQRDLSFVSFSNYQLAVIMDEKHSNVYPV